MLEIRLPNVKLSYSKVLICYFESVFRRGEMNSREKMNNTEIIVCDNSEVKIIQDVKISIAWPN